MFTAGSSTILTAVGDHLFAIGLFPLATCLETRPCEDYSKEAKWTKSRGDKSVKQSHGYLFHLGDSHLMEHWALNLQIMYPLSIGLDSKWGQSIHLQHFVFYKPNKCWSHRDGSSSYCGQIECLSGLVFNGQDMWTVNSAIRADWKLIVRCTEADPIKHCRKKNILNVFAYVHAYQRDDCQAGEYLIDKWGENYTDESTFKLHLLQKIYNYCSTFGFNAKSKVNSQRAKVQQTYAAGSGSSDRRWIHCSWTERMQLL